MYSEGEEWLDQVLDYLEGNVDYLGSYLSDRIPAIKLVQPEATYLVWMDLRTLGLAAEALRRLMLKKAGIHFDEGSIFGPERFC